MSSQGWAAAAQGLGRGLRQAKEDQQKQLENAAKQRLLQIQGEQLKNQSLKVKQDLLAGGMTESGEIDPKFMDPTKDKTYADAVVRKKREADFIEIPKEWAPVSQEEVGAVQGQGPTNPGASSGLGSLVGRGAPEGLEVFSSMAGKSYDPKLVSAATDLMKKKAGNDVLSGRPDIAAAIAGQSPLNPEQIQYLSSTPEGRSIFGSAQQAVNQARLGDQFKTADERTKAAQLAAQEDRDAAQADRKDARLEGQVQKATAWLDKNNYNAKIGTLAELSKELVSIHGDTDTSKLPGKKTGLVSNFSNLGAGIMAGMSGGGRAYQLLRQIADADLYKLSGAAVSLGEAARANIRSGLATGDAELIMSGVRDYSRALEMDANAQLNNPGVKALRDSGQFVLPSEAMGEQVKVLKQKPNSIQASTIKTYEPQDAASAAAMPRGALSPQETKRLNELRIKYGRRP